MGDLAVVVIFWESAAREGLHTRSAAVVKKDRASLDPFDSMLVSRVVLSE